MFSKKFAHILSLALALIVLISLFTGCSSNGNHTPERPSYNYNTSNKDYSGEVNLSEIDGEYCKVVRITDADTFTVDFRGQRVKIRLSCVNTPESATKSNRDTKEGKIASEFVSDLILNQTVLIETDTKLCDNYDRVLAYVYLEDGTMLNKTLLEMGYARVFNDRTNHRYTDEFFTIQDAAKSENRGFWACEELPWK